MTGTDEQPASKLDIAIPVSSDLSVLCIEGLHGLSVILGDRLRLYQLSLNGLQGCGLLYGAGLGVVAL